ncbi:MAG: methionine biosynthesis protein MetW [Candidatus Omnitrophica bacterium]|nr:methionine biosynthesis protein MetW [Candidatus Omnitrophota bacterium]MCL4735808.1 methionine biosynthesis protein MetW [Candidatus Omnitrophota bacterium]
MTQAKAFPEAETIQWLVELIHQSGLDLNLLKKTWESEGKSIFGYASPTTAIHGPRWDHALIQKIVTPGSRVLDCGCGSGDLLVELIRDHHVLGQGIEIDPVEVQIAVQHGVPVLQADLDVGLDGFGDDIFDFVILERTLQTVHRPLDVLKEMLRVGKVVIASFPNFAHWRNRLQLFLEGRMPQTPSIPYDWYETPNIHHMTIRDFKESLQIINAQIVEGYARSGGLVHPCRDSDDLTAEEALFVLCRSTEYIDGAGI